MLSFSFYYASITKYQILDSHFSTSSSTLEMASSTSSSGIALRRGNRVSFETPVPKFSYLQPQQIKFDDFWEGARMSSSFVVLGESTSPLNVTTTSSASALSGASPSPSGSGMLVGGSLPAGIRGAVEELLRRGTLSMDCYRALFAVVYHLCNAHPDPHSEALYTRTRELIFAHVSATAAVRLVFAGCAHFSTIEEAQHTRASRSVYQQVGGEGGINPVQMGYAHSVRK